MHTYPTMSLYDIQSGDMLAWSENPYDTMSDHFLKFIRFMTASEFGHVGIAWRSHDGQSDELLVVEATIPKIHISRATQDRSFYCVPMNVEWNPQNKHYLMDRIGLPYGLMDAIRAYYGKVVVNDRKYQCAELAHGFYEESGIMLPKEYRPIDVINNAVKLRNTGIYRVLV